MTTTPTLRLCLELQQTYPWHHLDTAFGVLWWRGNEWQLSAHLQRFQQETRTDPRTWATHLKAITCPFAIILESEDLWFAAVDRLRVHPLFHSLKSGQYWVSDAPYGQANAQLGADKTPAQEEFQLFGYCGLDDTLDPDLKSLAAGHWLIAHQGQEPRVEAYRPSIRGEENPRAPVDRIGDLCDLLMEELCEQIKGRQVILPLSSGFDSRLLAAQLKRHGHKDVLAYTYGLPGNWEQSVSQQVAEKLGFAWQQTPYSREAWADWYASDLMTEYFPFASRHVAAPHVQDWPAVLQLKEQGLLDDNAVFLPGHTCTLTSNQLRPSLLAAPQDQWSERLADALFRYHGTLQRSSRITNDVSALKQRIEQCIPEHDGHPHRLLNAYLHYETTERHAKMIINSVRVYEFFGYEHALPLWDGRLVDEWATVSMDARMYKRAFREYLHSRDYYGLFPIPPPNGRIKQAWDWSKAHPLLFHPLQSLKCSHDLLTGWHKHFLGWYGLHNYRDYLHNMGFCGNVYSLITREYIRRLGGMPAK